MHGFIKTILGPVVTPASPQARALWDIFANTLWVCLAIFLVVAISIIWCMWRYRRRPGNIDVPDQTEGHTLLEITWTVIPILILIFLFVLTVRAVNLSDPAPNHAPNITIIAHQWWWEVRYPDGTETANEIHIPVGVNYLVQLESADVIHDFWVPELGRKMDAIPGTKQHFWIRSDKPGNFEGACAEFCGAQHANMRILVIAQPKDQFNAWLKHEGMPAPTQLVSEKAKEGEQLFMDKTCTNCHHIKGLNQPVSYAPDLTHFASRLTLGSGVAKNNPGTLSLWLANPQKIKPGCFMPNLVLHADEVDKLCAYLDTLK